MSCIRAILILGIIIVPLRLSAQADTTVFLKNIKLENLEGEVVAFEDLSGKVVFLNFWATWCKSCVYEVPSISRASKFFDPEEIVFILASDESSKKIRKFQLKHGYEMEFLRLSSSFLDAGIKYVPTTLIIDQEGNLVKTHIGFRDWSTSKERNYLKSYIKK